MGIRKTDEIENMIDDCFRRESKLSEWEQGFMQSLDEQEFVTEKQIEKLDAIWERIT